MWAAALYIATAGLAQRGTRLLSSGPFYLVPSLGLEEMLRTEWNSSNKTVVTLGMSPLLISSFSICEMEVMISLPSSLPSGNVKKMKVKINGKCFAQSQQ